VKIIEENCPEAFKQITDERYQIHLDAVSQQFFQ